MGDLIVGRFPQPLERQWHPSMLGRARRQRSRSEGHTAEQARVTWTDRIGVALGVTDPDDLALVLEALSRRSEGSISLHLVAPDSPDPLPSHGPSGAA